MQNQYAIGGQDQPEVENERQPPEQTAQAITGVSANSLTELLDPLLTVSVATWEEPHYDAYRLFTRANSEPPAYGVYTYVLSGNGLDSQLQGTDIQKRYVALLEAIPTEIPHLRTRKSFPPEQTDLFCVPVKIGSVSSDMLSLDNYNSHLADVYRFQVEKQIPDTKIRGDLENDAGPFLISSLTQLARIHAGAPILFADLSSQNPNAMQEVLEVYKQRIQQTPLQPSEVFKSWKLTLLKYILDGDDYVKIEYTAYANMKSAAEPH
jgi:hypothetical protein